MARPRRASPSRRPSSPRSASQESPRPRPTTLVASDVQVDGAARTARSPSTRTITVAFSGSFTYGFREIPLPLGRAHRRDRRLRERHARIQPGALDRARAGRAAGHVRRRGSRRPHARSSGGSSRTGFQQRTFVVHYRLSGLAVGYDDVVDVNLKVWGDEWEQRLGRLTATMRGPGDVVRAWGHPVWVRGDVTLQGRSGAAAGARRRRGPVRRAPRALSARRVHLDGAACRSSEGNGLERIIAEELADAPTYERDKERIDDALAHPWRWLLLLLAARHAAGAR